MLLGCLVPGTLRAQCVTTEKLVVLVVGFQNFTGGYPWGGDVFDAGQYFLGNAGYQNSLKAFVQDVSRGRVTLAGSVHGPFLLPNAIEFYCSSGTCDSGDLDGLLTASVAAADPSVDFGGTKRLALVFGGPSNQFGFGTTAPYAFTTGEGAVLTSVMWMDRATVGNEGARAHEYGHNLGGQHPGGLRCGTYVPDFLGYEALLAPALPANAGALPSYFASGTCPVTEGGDPHDGLRTPESTGQAFHFSARYKADFGYLPNGVVVCPPVPGATFEFDLLPLETNGAGTRAVRIPIHGGFVDYWLEYRRPVGFDADLGVTGVLVKVASDSFRFVLPAGQTQRVGRYSESNTFIAPGYNQPFVLTPERFFLDQVNDNVYVEVLSMDATKARVRVVF
jgi:hypothetical protein